MALPYPTKVVLPFDIATAQDMNERHANDVALANGSGLDDGAVTADKLADTGWIQPTINSPFVQRTGSSYTVKYRRIGKMVYIQGMLDLDGMLSATGTIFTLPEGFRPDGQISRPASYGSESLAYITASGNYYIAGGTVVTRYYPLEVSFLAAD